MARFDDQDATLPSHDLFGFAEHDLELPRVLSRLLGHLERALSWLHVGEAHEAALGLRDDLLGHDEDIAIDEFVAGRLERGEHKTHEVVARTHFGDPVDRDDRERHRESARVIQPSNGLAHPFHSTSP